ncbi:MAG: hypothetical protein P8Y02_08630 [Deinococcales bacterium]
MRSLPSVLRTLAGIPMPASARPSEPVRSRAASASAAGLPSAHLEVARVEAMLRRYHGKPARIENPFAAFPTRAFWLERLMDDET